MKNIIIMIFVLAAAAMAQESAPVVNKKFLVLSSVSAASTFADSYTTMWATQNWNAHKTGVCNYEATSPWLYGKHPETGRTYAVAAGKSVLVVGSAYLLRKHHSKLWSVPLLALTGSSVVGVAQNMRNCN